MTAEPPKRRWFQIHLSTAIVLMFVAGGLVLSNVEKRRVDFDLGHSSEAVSYERGWPWTIWEEEVSVYLEHLHSARGRPETWKVDGLVIDHAHRAWPHESPQRGEFA